MENDSPSDSQRAARRASQYAARQTFAHNLRVCRHMRDISQEDLANKAEMSRSYVSGVEQGRRNVSINNMTALADALAVPLKNLVDPDWLSDISKPTTR
jgi:transcriptional regulator with XRE-family HTH domain